MSLQLIERGRVTDALVEGLRTVLEPTLLVGDGQVPNAAGWPGGQPGVGNFVASVTVRTMPGTPNFRDDLRSRHTSWSLGYSLRTIGGARQQADAMADLVRAAVVGLAVSVPGWSLTGMLFQVLAPVVAGSGDHPTYEVDDTVQVLMDRSRS